MILKQARCTINQAVWKTGIDLNYYIDFKSHRIPDRY